MNNNYFDLDKPLMTFECPEGCFYWTIREAVEGVQIFGGIGSGKTSSSGKTLALRYLSNNFGGLVLTVKPDERELWWDYCRQTGRLNDLIIVEPGGHEAFNFLEYLSAYSFNGRPITQNIVQLLKTVIQASKEHSGKKNDDAFWEDALDMLIAHTVDLASLAYGKVSVKRLFEIAQVAPRKDEPLGDKRNAFTIAYQIAQAKIDAQIEEWGKTLSPKQLEGLDQYDYEDLVVESLPDVALFRHVDVFFAEKYRNLAEKTRSIVDFIFSGFLDQLMREPIYSLFCRRSSTFTPEDSLQGKIILLNLPVKLYHEAGHDSQILFKHIWQKAMERRKIADNDRPVFLWADEAQHFLHEYDAKYQATARSSRIATVYISQNLPNYYAGMSGVKSDYLVKSFLGTMGTKIFHSNADIETNFYASHLIGDTYVEDISISNTVAGQFQAGQSHSVRLEKRVRPEHFNGLKTGAPLNDYQTEAYIILQGKRFPDGFPFQKVSFSQI